VLGRNRALEDPDYQVANPVSVTETPGPFSGL
jgi:hypothetical protein